MVNVVAALIFCEGKLLVGQRRADAAHPLKWEFPGGKVEARESDENALRRELREELGIDIEQASLVDRHEHQYPGGPAVSLRFYRIDGFAGEIHNRVFERIAWVMIADLIHYDLLEGDIPLVRKLSLNGAILPALSK